MSKGEADGPRAELMDREESCKMEKKLGHRK